MYNCTYFINSTAGTMYNIKIQLNGHNSAPEDGNLQEPGPPPDAHHEDSKYCMMLKILKNISRYNYNSKKEQLEKI